MQLGNPHISDQMLRWTSRLFYCLIFSCLCPLYAISKDYSIILSNTSIEENQSIGTFVGKISTHPETGAMAYSLQIGTGDADNDKFSIRNDSLFSNALFDFESKKNCTIRILGKENISTLFIEEQLEITVTNIPEPSTDLLLNGSTIREHSPIFSYIGTFSNIDTDKTDSYSYLLKEDGDNIYFAISNDTLYSNWKYDIHTRDTYQIRVLSTDSGGNKIEQTFSIFVTPQNNPPSDIALSCDTIYEYQPIGSLIGTFSTTDADSADAHFYTILSGNEGNIFRIQHDSLLLNSALTYSTNDSYSITVQSSDGKENGTISQLFAIRVLQSPLLNISPQTALACKGETILFSTEEADGNTIWFATDGTELGTGTELAVIAEEQTSIIVKADKFKDATATIEIKPDDACFEFKIFDFVTPNNDGKNDFFEISNIDHFRPISFSVYDKQGAILFSADDYQNDWNGSDLPIGSYAYRVEVPTMGKQYRGYLEIRR